MTYQTLYRKYRSQTFGDLVGQEAIRRALQGAVAADRVAHAYLFSGSRGTGKTTTARLLAKALNCLRRQPGMSEPCDDCESCRQVREGSALDLIEIDAASNRGIDEIRDLREKVNLAPALGRRKVYIIDEAHMLTPEAFNALLKTLEEPPQHVVFVLCTTDPNKIPATVLGRCQQFPFRRLRDDQIAGRLRHIADREGIEVEEEALHQIAQLAQGSLRDGIGLLDQLVPLAEGPITASLAREVLGVADPARLGRLWDLVLGGQPGAALEELGAIYEAGGELRQVVRGLMELCREQLVEAVEQGDHSRRDRLAGALESLLHLDGEVRRHGEPRLLVEAALVRLAVEASSQAGERTEERSGRVSPGRGAPAVISRPAAVAPAFLAPDGWRGVLEGLSPKTRAYFRDAQVEVEGEHLRLTFPYAFHHMKASENLAQIEPLVRSWLGGSATIELRLQESAGGRGAATHRSPAPEEHPLIKAAEQKLEAKVVRVTPLKEDE